MIFISSVRPRLLRGAIVFVGKKQDPSVSANGGKSPNRPVEGEGLEFAGVIHRSAERETTPTVQRFGSHLSRGGAGNVRNREQEILDLPPEARQVIQVVRRGRITRVRLAG